MKYSLGKGPEYVLYHINAFCPQPSWVQGSALLSVVGVQVKDFHHPLHLAGFWLGGRTEGERRRGGEGRVSWEEWAGSGANGPGSGAF